jgi:NAD(P)-dependent dehydrogenase (short-subunit alcohol dehydrogenase family)
VATIDTQQLHSNGEGALAGRVALVTGGTRGIGAAISRSLAGQGAAVAAAYGSNRGRAEELQGDLARSGVAISIHEGDVGLADDCRRTVQDVLDLYGRLDIVVNNAGILRDKSFGKMSVEAFDQVLAVHVRGSFLVTREAFPYLKEQGYGRIVNTSSPAGLFGSFGQANYSTAKMGLVGLTKTLGIEGARAGIKANAIAPIAWTRMTESILPAEFEAKFTAEAVSALVTFLAHESCEASGEVFSVGAGRVARVFVAEGPGWSQNDHTVEDIRDNWEAIMAEQPYLTPTTLGQQASASMKAML